MLVLGHQRYEHFGGIHEKLRAKGWHDVDMVQMTRGDAQNRRNRPSYAFWSRPPNALVAPASVKYLRASKLERITNFVS